MSFLAKVIFFLFVNQCLVVLVSANNIGRMFGLVCSLKCQNSLGHLGYTLEPAEEEIRRPLQCNDENT